MEALQRRIELLEVDLSRKVDQLQMDIDRIKQMEEKFQNITSQASSSVAGKVNPDISEDPFSISEDPGPVRQKTPPTKKKVSRAHKIKENTKNFIKTFPVYGIPRLAKTDKFLVRLVWAILITLSVSFGVFLIVKQVHDYYSFDVISNVERKTQIPFTFPAITICIADFYRQFSYINNALLNADTNSDYSIKDFIFSAEFKLYKFDISKLEFFKIPKQVGDCVRFNGKVSDKKLETVNKTFDQFSLIFKKNLTFISPKNETIVIQMFSPSFEVYVSDNRFHSYIDTEPVYKIDSSLGQDNVHAIRIAKEETELKLGEPYNDCKSSESDSQFNCIEVCASKEIRKEYNCFIPSYYKQDNLNLCDANTTEIGISQFKSQCNKECLRDCEICLFSTQYDHFPSANREMVGFIFSMSDLSSLEIAQIPKVDVFDLIPDIGGCLGIFVGATFISIAELVEFAIDVVCIIFIEHSN